MTTINEEKKIQNEAFPNDEMRQRVRLTWSPLMYIYFLYEFYMYLFSKIIEDKTVSRSVLILLLFKSITARKLSSLLKFRRVEPTIILQNSGIVVAK